MTELLYGRPIDEAMARMGAPAQAVAIESSVRTDGPDAGARRLRIVNGELEIDVLPDRGLDLGQVRIAGIPLAWISPVGFPRLHSGDVDGRGWLRAFGGGLLTTCGLLNVGPPAVDDGEQHPMHGRYSGISAQVTRTEVTAGEIVVEGIVHEATVLGSHLELRRRISTPLGARRLRVADTIVNRGASPVEPMVLYHLNFGWPLVDAGTQLRSPAAAVRPRDETAAGGLASWETFSEAAIPYPEQVFAHDLPPAGLVEVAIESPSGLRVRVGFDAAVLRGLFQWRVAEPGHYVLGVEPATVPTIHGRASARGAGLLRALAPGARLETGVDLVIDLPAHDASPEAGSPEAGRSIAQA
ncbi:aldose 1-epimerase family protein [Luethyella okanaganae]|uniref:Aldose 1-epimerase family protein n=1 Tax=Luethyella okanaganae TaxID=69372 RepID=A0ABW1VFS9_9MICO